MANAIVIYKGKPKTNSWARWMVGRTMRQNQNNLIMLPGKTGSGKTWSAISIFEIMAKMDGVPFTIDHIVFSLKELMALINSDKLKKGSKILFDEPQISISAREFQSTANKVFNYLLTTFRSRNLTLVFCSPFESLLDKNTRKLFHARFETLSLNRNNNTCRLKPRYIEYSDFKEQPYRKQMIVMFKDSEGNSRSEKLFFWDVPKPSQKLIDQYEEKKLAFTIRLNKNIEEKLAKFDESGGSMTAEHPEPEKLRAKLTPTQERTMKCLANVKESNKYQTASKILGRSVSSIHKNIKLSKAKGYSIEEFKEGGESES